MFKRILIANRGEIALRIIRACHELDIETVAVYSSTDSESLHVKEADRSICIGPSPSSKSYLNIKNIIGAANMSNCDAIHPGYGFLSENTDFAQACIDNDLAFIGPSPSILKISGNKVELKDIVRKARVPVIRGTKRPIKNLREALTKARWIRYPVMIKASAGGGGRGMRIIRNKKELVSSLQIAKTEAKSYFNDDTIFLEKYVEKPRHIETQLLVDKKGHIIFFGERDCTIQRRHQKVIEESPSIAIDRRKRKQLIELSIRVAKVIRYENLGTIEFLLDKRGNFYFMEINPRIQVEHALTEMLTGIDLAKQQILISSEEEISLKQGDIKSNGHAIEFRINSEDPDNNFMPSPGLISFYHPPGGPGIRVDSALYQGYYVSPHYDSLIAKLIVWGKDRDEAISRSKRALKEFIIEGVPTTIPFHLKILSNPKFLSGEIHTDFVNEILEENVGQGFSLA